MNTHRPTSPLRAPLALALAALSACVGADADTDTADPAASAAQPSVYRTDLRWPSSEIPVCFTNPTAANAATRARIESVILEAYSRDTRLRFTGWGACAAWGDAAPTAVRVRVEGDPTARIRPNSKVGPERADVTMNLYTDTHPDAGNWGGGWRPTVIHEFGHAIGLPHEQDRGDSPCRREPMQGRGDRAVFGPYDPDSLMNYCNPVLVGTSAGDRRTIQRLYGAPGVFRVEGTAVYRYTRPTPGAPNGERCHVVSPAQMDAFGGTRLLSDPDGNPWTVGLNGAPVDRGECAWPDGFYGAPGGATYFVTGSEYCQVESPAQLDAMGGPGVVQYGAGWDFNRARSAAGTCRWSVGFYQGPDGAVYRASAGTYCHVRDPHDVEALGGSQMIHAVPADATWSAGRTYAGVCYVGQWDLVNGSAAWFAARAAEPGARLLRGDFDGDGLTDLALTGVDGWASVPLALARGDGTFREDNRPLPGDFGRLAAEPGATAVVGDFDGNGRADIALVGRPGWTSIPVAHATEAGGFRVTNEPVAQLPQLAQQGAQVVAGDFDGDGDDDLALTGVSGWAHVPFGFSSRDGRFAVELRPLAAPYAALASSPGVRALAGQFNGADADGVRRADIALVGVNGWTTIPLLCPAAIGFTLLNPDAGAFPAASAQGALAAVGDFNGDGNDDIALSGVAGWTTIPVAFSKAGAAWEVENDPNGAFRVAAATAGARLVAGRFNRDRRADLALAGPNGWASVPVALRRSLVSPFESRDFNGDGRDDILWRNRNTGELYAWFLDASSAVLGDARLSSFIAANQGWQVAGTGDFNGDRRPDILWHHPASGLLSAWMLDGTRVASFGFIGYSHDAASGWRVAGAGDFDRDGSTDVLWHHATSGEVRVLYLDGTVPREEAVVTASAAASTGWSLVGTGDFNRDGWTDLLWHHGASGQLQVWYLEMTRRVAWASLSWTATSSSGWAVVGTGDYNRDGRVDVLWHHGASGLVGPWHLDATRVLSNAFTTWQARSTDGWDIVSR